ncbi:hypothetical protein BG000_001942 [Podila horticola]|nr:hypothetical protein BG000_001942 [Podila horticola]
MSDVVTDVRVAISPDHTGATFDTPSVNDNEGRSIESDDDDDEELGAYHCREYSSDGITGRIVAIYRPGRLANRARDRPATSRKLEVFAEVGERCETAMMLMCARIDDLFMSIPDQKKVPLGVSAGSNHERDTVQRVEETEEHVGQASINWFEKLPVEVVCIVLEMTVALPPEPYADGDDGDGPKVGNPIFYWHTDPTRVTLRLVCRSWNQIILSMARDVHVEIGADESLKTMKASEEARNRRIATTSSSNRGRGNNANQSDRNMNLGSPSIADPTVRRSVRIAATSMSSTSNSPYSSTLNLRASSQSYNDILAEEAVRQYGVYSDRHPRLYQRIMQAQSDKRRAVNQIPIPLQVFYNLRTPAAPSGDVQASPKARESNNPWSCPPNINSLFIYGILPKMSHPQENEVLLPGSSAAGSSAGGGSFHDNPDCPEYHIQEDDHGTALDHWLRAAVPRYLTKFSINCSSDFGLSGLLSLPRSLKSLEINRCSKVTGGVLLYGFRRLENLTMLAMCSDQLFVDESFTAALGTLVHLRRLIYTFPCDPVQPAWRDLFRYCSSCELYHRINASKNYTRQLLMPQLPNHITDFTFAMDEIQFQKIRVDPQDQYRRSLSRTESTRFCLNLWKTDYKGRVENSDRPESSAWCGFDLSPEAARSWWPENLTRLDLSNCTVIGSKFDVPPRLCELVIGYPLQPKELPESEANPALDSWRRQWFPQTLISLEIQGVPYHASCEMQDDPELKVKAWMTYSETLLGMVPHNLKQLTLHCFQVPQVSSLNLMTARCAHSLKEWTLRLLCPQRPRDSGYTPMQLYSPVIFVDEDSSDDDLYDSDGLDSDGEEYYQLMANRLQRRLSRDALRDYAAVAEADIQDTYDETPIRIRNACKRLNRLRTINVDVNFQHYKYCSARWNGDMGLTEPTKPLPGGVVCLDTFEDEDEDEDNILEVKRGQHTKQSQNVNDGLTFGGSANRSKKGKVHTEESSMGNSATVKGKGKTVDRGRTEGPIEDFSTSVISSTGSGACHVHGVHSNSLYNQLQPRVEPKAEVRYWHNSCCGKRCLGWIRVRQD